MQWKRIALLAPVVSALALGASAKRAPGQEADSLRQQYLIVLPRVLAPALAERARGAPGSSSGSPASFGAAWGDVFMGAGLQARTRYARSGRDGVDGSVVLGFGLGDARELVGLEVAVASVSTIDSGFFDRTAVSTRVPLSTRSGPATMVRI